MNQNRVPGVGTSTQYDFRQIMAAGRPQYLPGGVVIDGDMARDPLHTSYVDTLRAGLLLGRITSGGLWAPSILGVSAEAMAGDETEMDVSVATATEIVRRLGASGTFKLVGPPSASGVVRTATVTYSSCVAATGKITMSALGTSEVQTITASSAPTVGDWYIRYMGDDGVEVESAAIAYNDDAAAIQAHIRAVHADLAAVVVTDSGAAGLSDGTVTITWPQAGATAGPHALIEPFAKGTLLATAVIVSLTCARSATGVNGEFVTGSLIMPTDGSETIRGILGMESGLKVTDDDGVTNLDVECSRLIVGCGEGGVIDASQIINYPADASLKAYVKAALRATGGSYVFDDDFNA